MRMGLRTVGGDETMDIADLLPAGPREKLVRLRESVAMLHGANVPIWNHCDELLKEKQDLERQIRHLQGRVRFGAIAVPDDDRRVTEPKKRIERLSSQIERLVETRDAGNARWKAEARLLRNCEGYVVRIAIERNIEPHLGKLADPKAHSFLPDQVDSIRRKIAKLKADIHRAQSAPKPSGDVKRIAIAEIKALAERGRPDVFGAIEGGQKIKWPTVHADVTMFDPRNPVTVIVPDMLAIHAWQHEGDIIRRVETEIDNCADDAHAISDDDRASRIAELKYEVLGLERQEERLIELAGGVITRRSDADVRAVLGLSDAMPEPGGP
jgi:hypothetical protein